MHGTDPLLRYVGRVDRTDHGVVRMAWPATTLSFRIVGTSFVRLVARDVSYPDATHDTDFLAVSIDGQPAKTIALREGEAVYTLTERLSLGEHTIAVAKRTEAEVGTVSIVRIEFAPGGRVLPLRERNRRRIEVLGDSITAGFGDEGIGPECGWHADQENALITYGALAARELDAEYVALAWSGRGLVRNANPEIKEPFGPLFERTLPHEPAAWPFWNHPAPDAVVINLGANDVLAGPPDEVSFRAAYAHLVARVRHVYPTSFIVLIVSPLIWDDEHSNARSLVRAWLEAIVATYARAGDDRVKLLEQWASRAEPVGCQFHPGRVAHARFAHELVAFLKPLLGG